MTMTSDVATAPAPARGLRYNVVTAPIHPRTWRELLHVLLDFPIGVAGLCFVATFLGAGLLLTITLVGLPLLALILLGCRGIAAAERWRARVLLGERISDPAPYRPNRPGVLPWLKAALLDGPGWRGALYLVLLFAWGTVTFCCLAILLISAGLLAGYPIWRPLAGDAITVADHPVTGLWEVGLATAIGIVLIFLTPWVVHGFAQVDRVMARGLLGRWTISHRVRDLEESREQALDTAAADLRRIERDLHDGAQARLVALAMDLGSAKEKIAQNPVAASELIAKAHDEAKQALAELHDIARGIYPAILSERGLDPALSAIAARCAVPVAVSVDLPGRPAPGVEAVTYYGVSELLANVSRHSGARSAEVAVRRVGDRLHLVVRDDGAGGADPAKGTGLTGLAERVRAVDGSFHVHSPPGGPTVITMEMPWTP